MISALFAYCNILLLQPVISQRRPGFTRKLLRTRRRVGSSEAQLWDIIPRLCVCAHNSPSHGSPGLLVTLEKAPQPLAPAVCSSSCSSITGLTKNTPAGFWNQISHMIVSVASCDGINDDEESDRRTWSSPNSAGVSVHLLI